MGPEVEFFVMQISLIMVVLILHTYMGIHIIRRGIIFCDLVLDQLAAFGVVVGIGLGIRYGTPLSYALSSAAVVVGCVLLTILQPRRHRIPQEAVIGILYGLALIASLLLADQLREGGTHFEKTQVGSMLWVSWPLVGITVGVYSALGILHWVLRRPFQKLTDHPGNYPGRAGWNFLFFLTQGIITILIVPVAGVLLAYGFLMIPAAIGTLFSRRWGPALLVGWAAGMASCLFGIFYSFRTDSPYGPSLLLSMGVCFVLALLLRGATSAGRVSAREQVS